MPRKCAFCGQARRLTREHLWPAALHARLSRLPGESDRAFWTARLGVDLPNDPVVRDVCKPCNSGPLSELDSYICSLWDKYFRRSLNSGDKVVLKYDYHLLSRWLLKMCFNSARVNSGWDRFAFEPLLPYIIDGRTLSASSLRVFAELQYAARIPQEDLDLINLPGAPNPSPPDGRKQARTRTRSDAPRVILSAYRQSTGREHGQRGCLRECRSNL